MAKFCLFSTEYVAYLFGIKNLWLKYKFKLIFHLNSAFTNWNNCEIVILVISRGGFLALIINNLSTGSGCSASLMVCGRWKVRVRVQLVCWLPLHFVHVCPWQARVRDYNCGKEAYVIVRKLISLGRCVPRGSSGIELHCVESHHSFSSTQYWNRLINFELQSAWTDCYLKYIYF